MAQSNFGKISWRDLLHGFIVSFLSASLTRIIELLDKGALPGTASIKTYAIIGFTAGLSYVLKNFLQNSNGELLKKD